MPDSEPRVGLGGAEALGRSLSDGISTHFAMTTPRRASRRVGDYASENPAADEELVAPAARPTPETACARDRSSRNTTRASATLQHPTDDAFARRFADQHADQKHSRGDVKHGSPTVNTRAFSKIQTNAGASRPTPAIISTYRHGRTARRSGVVWKVVEVRQRDAEEEPVEPQVRRK